MFRKYILSLIFVFCFGLSAAAQTDSYSAPVKWERYRVGDSDVSVLLPKMPILLKMSNWCSELGADVYSAYAEKSVYTLRIVSKIKVRDWDGCPSKIKFDEKSFSGRIREILTGTEGAEELKYRLNDSEAVRITARDQKATTTYWLFNDIKNNRWYEIWATRREQEIKPETAAFAASIKFEKDTAGIEINGGAAQTFGDQTEKKQSGGDAQITAGTGSGIKEDRIDKANPAPAQNSEKDVSLPLMLVHKPQARYTDEARRMNIQGMVTLKVTFQASGGIGSVSVVNGLPYGLTEKAIEAARKMAFLPAQRNDTTYSITKTVSYSFTIY